MKVTRKVAVTLPPLSFKNKEILYLRFETELRQAEHAADVDDGREPATTARVINLETGELNEFIAPTLLVSAMARYGAHAGKCFEIHCTKDKLPGKNYRGVTCYEIAEPEGTKDRIAAKEQQANADAPGAKASDDAGGKGGSGKK